MITKEEILEALKKVMDPELGRSIVQLNMVRDIEISEAGDVSFTLALTIPGCPLKNQMESDARTTLMALPGIKSVEVTFGTMTDKEKEAIFGSAKPELPKLNKFDHISASAAAALTKIPILVL